MTEHTLFSKLKNSIGLKVINIFIMIILLLIPNNLVQELINERRARKVSVEKEIWKSYGQEQVIYPAFIKIPYVRTQYNSDNKPYTTEGHLGLSVNSSGYDINITTDTRERSIFEVVVYEAEITSNSTFTWQSFKPGDWTDYKFNYEKAYLVYCLKDANGIEDSIEIVANGQALNIEGNEVINIEGNEVISIAGFNWLKTESLAVDISQPLTIKSNWLLKGTKGLYFEPMGDLTEVKMQSTWPDPSFTGKNTNDVTDDGFTAKWKVNKFAHKHPKVWLSDQTALATNASHFGVNLIQPVNEYGKNFRTSKYALLIISLTFGIFFFFEILLKKSIHTIQYTLVGFALTVFYLLLLSISEHLGFNNAYLISSIATVSLIAVYTHFILKKIAASSLLLALLSGLFAYVFIILQMQDFALLAGAIALFVVLAAVMLLSRNVDWYNLGKRVDLDPVNTIVE